MIVYFSATGNNKYIAERIAAVTGDPLVSISDCVKENRYDLALAENETLGFVTPTYFWGLPSIVTEFVQKVQLQTNGSHYVYHVLSFGSSTGTAGKMMEALLADKGMALQGRFSVRMVDTWTPMFDLSDAEKKQRDTLEAEPQIDEVIARVQKKAAGDFDHNKGFVLFAKMVQKEYQGKRETKNLHVLDRCIGCGLCAKQCPESAITLQNGKPVWVRDKCAMCLGCLHRCPKFAIQYRDKTENRGQFVNPNVEL